MKGDVLEADLYLQSECSGDKSTIKDVLPCALALMVEIFDLGDSLFNTLYFSKW